MSNFNQNVIKNHASVIALRDFVFDEYQINTFTCSWQNCNFDSSRAETLLDNVFEAIPTDDPFSVLPDLCFAIVREHAKTNDQVTKFAFFMSDVMRVLFECHVRDEEIIHE